MFEKLVEHIKSQKTELDELRDALLKANQQTIEANRTASSELQRALEEEWEQAALDQAKLLSQIKELVEESAQAQRNRLRNRVSRITSNITSSGKNLEAASRTYREGMNGWVQREDDLVKEVTTTRDTIKNRMQSDWTVSHHGLFCRNPVLMTLRALNNATNLFRKRQKPSMRRQSGSWMLRCRAWRRRWKRWTTL